MNPGHTMNNAKNQALNKTRQTVNTPVVEGLARFGYIARGVVYAIIGLLAVQLAFSTGGQATNQTGAIQMIAAQPFGDILLILVTIGLFGYALWGVIRALLDPLGRGSDAKGLVERAGFLISAISYATLGLLAFNYLSGYGNASAGKSPDIAVQLLSQPFGKWLVILLGVFWILAGAGQLYTAWKEDFEKDLKPNLPANERRLSQQLGRVGYAARGIVFLVIGFLTIRGGVGANAKQAVGFDDALLQLAHGPYGTLILGIVAVGLVAFGVYSMLCARWMTILPGKNR